MKRRRKFSLGSRAQKKSPSLSYLVLVSLWLGANVASEGLEEFSFFLEPAFAVTQWLVLWLGLRNLGWWVIASTNGWLTAFILIHLFGVGDWIAAIVPRGELDFGGVPLSIQAFWASVLVRLLEWAVIGVFQWLVLRRHIEQASKWILASALGGAVKGGVELVGSTLVGDVPGALVGSLGYGAVTGVALVWLLSNRPKRRKSRVRATLRTMWEHGSRN